MRMADARRMILAGMLVSLVFVAVSCVWLSLSAETLDEIAERFGASESPVWAAPIPDYEIPGLQGNIQANIAVGALFTLVVLAVTFGVARGLTASRKD
jgi:hypothetical protein